MKNPEILPPTTTQCFRLGNESTYWLHGGKRVAMRVGASTWYFLLTDHLGSTARTATSSGTLYAELRYRAW